MAGASIQILEDDSQLLGVLNRLSEAGQDLQSPFADFGEYWLISHRDRFALQESPDGMPWAPLSPQYQARKPKNPDKILVLEGLMLDGLNYDASATELAFGTNAIQGATHQFGDPERNIPAREWLGMTAADEQELLAILSDHLTV